MKVSIRRLDDHLDRARFDCGDADLNLWLQQQAGQAQRRHLVSVWIASPDDDPARIAGFHSLAPAQIAFEDCPAALKKRLPHYPVAVSLLARLAVDRTFQGKGLGAALLADAMTRVHAAARTIPVQALVVHAKDGKAAEFYRHHDFIAFTDRPHHLYLPMTAMDRLFAG